MTRAAGACQAIPCRCSTRSARRCPGNSRFGDEPATGWLGSSCSSQPRVGGRTVNVRRRLALMGIVRTVEWSMSAPPPDAERRLREAMESLGMEVNGDGDGLRASSARSIRRNRWAAELTVDLSPMGTGTCATCRVDMAGNKHYTLLDELAEAVGEDAFDYRGIEQAIGRLDKGSRIFGRKEVRHLRHLIHAGESVVCLAHCGGTEGAVPSNSGSTPRRWRQPPR
jgi:hypothetical protein